MGSRHRNTIGYEKDDDIYTPPSLFQQLNVTFDLDVCAPEVNLPWIPANRHYSLKDDGLIQPWFGRVWCNPPYSYPRPWVEKFINHANGIMLVQISNSYATDLIWEKADAIKLIAYPQFKFKRGGSDNHKIFMPVWLIAMGEDCVKALIKADLGKVR